MKNKSNKTFWKKSSKNGLWNEKENWEGDTLPQERAVFAEAETTRITFSKSESTEVGTIEFAEEASSFLILLGTSQTEQKLILTISGKGVINRSGLPQNIKVAATNSWFRDPQLMWKGKASAGGTDMYYESGPESLEEGYGGGIIGFTEESTAGEANFTVRTGKVPPPDPHVQRSTVGGEVSFSDHSTARKAKFTIYGSLGRDGDTFGNTVFHDHASADHATFINVGGTVEGGDGGNTQFYDQSTSAHGLFLNFGASHEKGNGGDVAFDGNASGSYGIFHNMAATAEGGNGGVTSFNNNPPKMQGVGASAGHGFYHNYGAREKEDGGGGHTEFTAKYGSCIAHKATIMNYGSVLSKSSTAGHTIFTVNLPNDFHPSAGQATIWNYASPTKDGSGGYTEFAAWDTGESPGGMPTADKATILNAGAEIHGAQGGHTKFSQKTKAGEANLIAYGGNNGGEGGTIIFSNQSEGNQAKITLYGNGTLDLSDRSENLEFQDLTLFGGIILTKVDLHEIHIRLSGELRIPADPVFFSFRYDPDELVEPGKEYLLLKAKNLNSIDLAHFAGSDLNDLKPNFSIKKNELFVSFEAY
ncbi:hypothetical protein [Algoriphagus namhaensis]